MTQRDEQRQKLQALFQAMTDVFELVLREARDRQPPTTAPSVPPNAHRPAPTATMNDDRLWDVGDVAKFLQASRSWVYKAAEVGTLPCLRIGAMLRFEPHAVMKTLGLDPPTLRQTSKRNAASRD